MTEKQFFIINGKHMVLEYEFYRGKNRLSPSEVIDLLNAQHEEIKRLKLELDTHKHPLWSTRQAEAKVNKLVDIINELIEKNTELYAEINQLRIENMRLKALKKVI